MISASGLSEAHTGQFLPGLQGDKELYIWLVLYYLLEIITADLHPGNKANIKFSFALTKTKCQSSETAFNRVTGQMN